VITPQMIDAGVHAFSRHYDSEAEGLENLRLTVAAILSAGIKGVDHLGDCNGGLARELR
jgi:hypothetical protein